MTGDQPTGVASRFIDAIAWGEHHTVWDLLSPQARRTVLRLATDRGMDEGLAARLRDGTASRSEREVFLADLVNGLRADLIGTDVDNLVFLDDPDPEPGRARVILTVPFPPELEQGEGVPVGSVELIDDGDGWLVERLVPRPGVGAGPSTPTAP